MSADEAIAAVAARQYGVFTRMQAIAAGFSKDAIRRRVESGRWLILHRGVYAIAGAPATREQEIFAAVASYGPTAVAFGPTAAELFGLLERAQPELHVALPRGQRRRPKRRISPHQASLSPGDVRTLRGIRVTGPNRTLVDLAGAVAGPELAGALDTALFRGLTSVHALKRYIVRRNLGQLAGLGRLGEMLDDRMGGSSQSKLERIFFDRLRRSGLPKPTRQYRVGDRYIDISFPAKRLIIELDGRGSRFTAAALREDRRRQNEIVLALPGWTLLRFTWDDVVEDWPHVERILREKLRPA